MGWRFLPSILFLVAAQGCGGKTELDASGSGGLAAGGSGALSGSGGLGGSTPAGGTGGSGGSGSCQGCASYDLPGLGDLPACCDASGQCGVSIDDGAGSVLALPAGCYGTETIGGTAPDILCPPIAFTDPLTQQPAFHPGCCNFISGTCGVHIQLSSGPFLGCVDVAGGTASSSCGKTSECGQCLHPICEPEINECALVPDCLKILECAVSCVDTACVDNCLAAHPDGAVYFPELKKCASSHCSYFCAIE